MRRISEATANGKQSAKATRATKRNSAKQSPASLNVVSTLPLWQLDIGELTGHNIESRGRDDVNELLQQGWLLLHIYTLKYEENGVWRERPMAILGKLRPKAPPPQLP